jgi:transposase InsO family protein
VLAFAEQVAQALDQVPRFLLTAAGLEPSDPVVVSFYGGDGRSGSRHLHWRSDVDGGGALPVLWDEALRQEVQDRLLPELEKGRQLGFIAGVGGSKKAQVTHVYGLRAEIDIPDSHELQQQVYAAVEERYGIRFTLLDTGGKSLHAWIAAAAAIPVDRYSETSKRWHALITEVAQEAGLDLPEGALDAACHRPTQVMRLPGAVHRKTGKVAEVIQWGEKPVAIVDLFSRNVLSWKLSNSLDTEFCLEALEMALEGDRKPEIFHSDQGCQFTSSVFLARLQAEAIKISWSGRKRCYDNILVERLWRTVKYEEVYLRAYSDGWEAEINLARFLWRYCHVRPHSSLGGRTPHEVYTQIEPCSSRLELTTSGARSVQ